VGSSSSAPQEEVVGLESLDFKEVTEEAELLHRSTIINRAPIMTTWAMVVAERLGFRREEALSIASVYTEMNAVSKGSSLGIIKKDQSAAGEVLASPSQPHIDLMGRRIPLLSDKDGQWRALTPAGTPVWPESAYSYMTNALRQTTPYIIGAMRLLAATYTAAELNQKGFGFYASFRPQVEQWGGRSTVRCKDILELRKKPPKETDSDGREQSGTEYTCGADKFISKRTAALSSRAGLSLEEYEAALSREDPYEIDIQQRHL